MRRLLSFLLFSSFLLCQNIETIVSNKNVSLNESLDFIIKLKNIDTNPEVNFVPMLDYFSIISGPNIGSEYKFINGKKGLIRKSVANNKKFIKASDWKPVKSNIKFLVNNFFNFRINLDYSFFQIIMFFF